MQMMQTRIVTICAALLMPIAAYAQSQTPIVISFEKGLNYRDDATLMQSGWTTGDTYNFLFNPDGSAEKGGGFVADSIGITAADSSVDFLSDLSEPIALMSTTYGFGVIGGEFYRRNTGTGAWTSITSIDGLNVTSPGLITSTPYLGRLILAGDMSSFVQFDGEDLSRLPLKAYTGQTSDSLTATASAGGSLDSNTTYQYTISYINKYGDEGFTRPYVSATTTGTNRTITLSNIPSYPSMFALGGDTTVIAARNIYRGSDDEYIAWYDALLDPTTTEYVDTGALSTDMTKLYDPGSEAEITQGKYIASYNDFLWASAGSQPTRWSIKEVVDAGTYETWYIYPEEDHARNLVKVHLTYADVAATTYITSIGWGRYQLSNALANFTEAGVVPGDYVVSNSDGYDPARVLAVRSDTSLVIDGLAAAPVTIGNNIYRVDDEIISIRPTATAGLLILYDAHSRGLFGTTKADHSAGAVLHRVEPLSYGSYVYYSEPENPARFDNYANPFEIQRGIGGDITGMLALGGGDQLAIFKESAVFSLIGTEPSNFHVSRISDNVGCVAPRSLVGFQGGGIMLGEDGVYALGGSNLTNFSDVLGTAITDSSASAYYDEAAGIVHDNQYWLSVVKDGTSKETIVWVYDFRDGRNTWRRYKGDPVSDSPLSIRTWGRMYHGTESVPRLFAGDWRKGNVMYYSRTSGTNVDSAGTDQNITAQLITPRYSIENADATFDELRLRIDTNDSVRVSFEIVGYDSTFTVESPFIISRADSSFSEGSPRVHLVPINAIGNSCQVKIWTTGSGRCKVYPSHLIVRKREL